MPDTALAPGETYGDYLGGAAPEALRQCSFVNDFGGFVCFDPKEAPGLIDTGQTVVGGAINDAKNALRTGIADLGTTFRNDIVAPAKSIGAWMVVVLGLVAFIAFEVRR